MGFYQSSEQFYTIVEQLLDELKNNQSSHEGALNKTRLAIRLQMTEPEAIVNINGRKSPVSITFGENKGYPDIDVRMPADTFHRILLDEESVKNAFLDKKLIVKGPFWKTGSLVSIFEQAKGIYPDILRNQGFL